MTDTEDRYRITGSLEPWDQLGLVACRSAGVDGGVVDLDEQRLHLGYEVVVAAGFSVDDEVVVFRKALAGGTDAGSDGPG